MRKVLLIWDIDGTLIHCGSCGRDALNKTFKELFSIDDAFAYVRIGRAMDSVLLNEILEETGIPFDKKDEILKKYAIILEEVLEAYPQNRILPGIRDILEYTQEKNNVYNCITTSNFEIGAKVKLKSHNLEKYFITGGFGDLEEEKWHAVEGAIIKTEKHYNVHFDKEDIYMIGDTWYDIQCARKVGIKSLAVATGWTSLEVLKGYSPDYLFEDLSDIKKVIQLLKI